LPLDKGKESSSEALVDAAHLAAHFSGHRAEASVEVQYAPRGQVRKPRGSPPGFVVVDHARAMLVRMEPDRLARLLASEEVA
jgi:predicted ribosome quality control (RQC) complex YloA/Tae2 family protein